MSDRSVAVGSCILALCALLVSGPARGELIKDHFNLGTSGTHLLLGWSGPAMGWNGPWEGFHNGLHYFGDASLCWNQPGYSNAGNDPAHGRAVPITLKPNFRRFPAGIGGTVWVSQLTEHFSNSNGKDSISGGHFNNPQAFWGIDGSRGFTPKPYVEFWKSPSEVEGISYGPTIGPGQSCPGLGHTVHLVIAKLEFNYDADGHDRVSVWVDPTDLLHGEAGLGSPDVMRDGFNAWGSWTHFNFSGAIGNSFDSVRISFSGSTPASLREILMPECGDGELDDGEECDAGGAAGACCTPSCQFASPGTVCRPLAHACDVEEVCSGASADCPPDLALPDPDGNGVCNCVEDLVDTLDELEVQTVDDDGDGVRNLDDRCPATPSGAPVDLAGCSQDEFCGAIDVSNGKGRRACRRSDFGGDEPGVRPRDCRVEGAECVSRGEE